MKKKGCSSLWLIGFPHQEQMSVLCQKGIDDIVQHYLAKEGIIAVRRIKESDMSKLSRATGARIVTNTDELSKDDIGLAELVEERKIETDKWVFIEGCKNPKAVTILIRGGSQRLVDEAERSIHDALMAVKCVVECPSVVVGGGSSEAIVSRKLREWSASLGSRQQITISPSSGSVLTSVDVTGTGFTPISVVTITFDGNFVDTVTTTSVGSLHC